MFGTPAIGMGGLAPNKPVAKAIMLTSWQHHMDSVAERSKAVAQDSRRHPTIVIPTHQTDRCRWSQAAPPFFSFCFWMCLWNHHQVKTMSRVAQWLVCWAHNPKVPGSKPGSAMVWHDLLSCIFRSASVPQQKAVFWELNPGPLTP